MSRPTVRTLLLFLSGCLPQIAFAQNYLYGIGGQTWGINIPIENGFINVANGEIHLEIPLASIPQRGSLELNERLVYDSRIWQIMGTGPTFNFEPTNVPSAYSGVSPACTGNPQSACSGGAGTVSLTPITPPNAMAGWRFVAGNETGILQEFLSGDLTDLTSNSIYNWGWTDPSGTLHYFPITTGTQWCNSCGATTGSGYAMDGSGFYMTVSDYNSAIVFDASGNEVYPSIIDRNGNAFSTDSNGNLIDTIGRTPVKVSTGGNHIYYDVLTIGGVTKRYTITTESINVSTDFQQSGVNDFTGSLTAIESIELPDGSTYEFTYDNGTSGNYGEMVSMTLPTGGTVNFGWENYQDSYQNENRWVSSYSGGEGSYSFSPSELTQCSGPNEVGCKEEVTVVDGNSNTVNYTLTLNNGAWNTIEDFYKGSATHILSAATSYDFSNSAPSWFGAGSMWVTASSTTTTLIDTSQMAQTQYAYLYPWSGKPSTVKMWDYYSGSQPTTPTKEIDITYGENVNGAYFQTQANVINKGTTEAATIFNYDGNAPSTAVGATDLGPAPGGSTRGNLTSVVSGIGTTVLRCSTYDSAGQKLNDTSGNVNIGGKCATPSSTNSTSYSYSCSDAYIAAVEYPIIVSGSNLKTQTTTDCSSGLVTATEDMNGTVSHLQTLYSYFDSGAEIGKLESLTYPDNSTKTSSKSYSYPSSAEVEQSALQSTSGVNVVSESIIDGYGRPYQSVRVAPEGSISTETEYEATGRPGLITTAHLDGTTSPTDGATSITYDVLGRTTGIMRPDGNMVIMSYTGPTQTVTDELGHQKSYTYDAFQRLVKVMEPNSSGALAFETDYQYNALDELFQVDQWGGPSGSSGDRQRVFAYDSLGRMIAENIPENQSSSLVASSTCSGTASGTKWTMCYSYDSDSNVTSTMDNVGNIVNYTYDAMDRVLSQKQSSSGISYSYMYDGTDGYTHTNPLGELTWSANNNASAGESLSYDSMARLITENVCVFSNCSYNTVAPTQNLVYDEGAIGISVQAGPDDCGPVGSYGEGSTPESVASSLAANINSNCVVISATSSGASVVVTSTSPGPSGDYAISAIGGGSTNPMPFSLSLPSKLTSGSYASATFTFSGSEQSVTSGGTTTYDGGEWGAQITIPNQNVPCLGFAEYGQGSTPTSMATALAASMNTNSNCTSTFSATASGAVVTVTATAATPGSQYSASSFMPAGGSPTFPNGSFTLTPSGSTLSGPVFASATLTVTGSEGSSYITSAGSIVVSGTYDFAGNLTSLTYPDGRVVQPTYDSANRLNGVNYQAWGSTSVGSSYYAISKFAPPGQPINATMGNGDTVTASFDNRQDIRTLKYANSAGTSLWSKQFAWDRNGENLLLKADVISGIGRQFAYDSLNRVTSAQDMNVGGTGSAKASATITFSGSESSATVNECPNAPSPPNPCNALIPDGATYTLYVNGDAVGSVSYGSDLNTTSAALASALAASINANSGSPVTASVSGSVLTLTSVYVGSIFDYNVSIAGVTNEPEYFSAPFSYTVSPTSTTLSGGADGTAPANGLNQTFSYDPFGNLTQAGTFSFSQSFNALNQVVGFPYDANGDQTSDIFNHPLAFDANGMLSSVSTSGETYTYDAQGNRAEVVSPTQGEVDYIYFGSTPIAVLIGSAYTDLIYSGSALVAEVPGSQTAAPTYRITDNLESLGGNLSSTGALAGTTSFAPYGQTFSNSTTDSFGFTGLLWDSTTALWHAGARQFSPQQGRWQSPDLYEGSYNWADPQTLNRYAYVNGRPMWATDPSGRDIFDIVLPSIPEVLTAAAWLLAPDILVDFLNRSDFHGSLKPRPAVSPWDDKFGVPYGGLANSIGQAFGLPDGGCEFGACGAGPMSLTPGQGGSGAYSQQSPILVPVVYYNGTSFNLGMAPPPRPDPHKVCVNNFESSPDGRFYNFWSLVAPLIGPDRTGSAKEDTVGVGSKYVAVKWFQYLGYEDFVGLVKTVAGKGLLPLSIAATAGQITGHIGCQFVTE